MSQSRTAMLVASDGTSLPLTEAMYQAALTAAHAASSFWEQDEAPSLTTGDAAALLGVSRSTLNRMLDAGAIAYERYGSKGHRRLRRSDVLAYREASAAATRQALDEMRDIAADAGFYDPEGE